MFPKLENRKLLLIMAYNLSSSRTLLMKHYGKKDEPFKINDLLAAWTVV